MTLQAGTYITDGTAVFIIDDVRDGFRVGDIVFRPTLHDGFIKEIGAGLPNITGKINVSFGYSNEVSTPEGALYGEVYDKLGTLAHEVSDVGHSNVRIDASRSNPIYGASATVQPPALALIPQIKY